MGFFSSIAGFSGGYEYMTSAENNHKSANAYVKDMEQSVNRTKSAVKENTSDSLFAVSQNLLEMKDVINQKYRVSGDASKENILEDWTAIIEMRKEIRMESVAIDNEAKKIEERFRQMAGL